MENLARYINRASLLERMTYIPEGSSKEHRKNWDRLIQKIYETDLLCRPNCLGKVRILSFIDDPDLMKKILKHLDL